MINSRGNTSGCFGYIDMNNSDNTTKNSKGSFKLICRFLKGSKRYFAISVLSAGLVSLADMLDPQIIRMAVDNVIGGEPGDYSDRVMGVVNSLGGFEYLHDHLWIVAMMVIAVALLRVAAQYSFRVSNTAGSETLVRTMRNSLFSHIERLPFSWHMKNHTGDIIQRCTSDINTMRNFASEQLTSVFRIVILLIFSLIFMFRMDPALTGIAFIPIPVIVVYAVVFHNRIREGFTKCDENEGVLSTMVQENLTGVRVVRAFGRERYEKDRFEKHNEYYTTLWVKLGKLLSRYWSSQDLLSGLQIMLVVVFGAAFCVNGRMTAGEYIAFFSYNALLTWPIRMLGRMISEMSKAGVSMDRIRYIMESEEEHEPENAIEPDMTGDIRFDHVSFAYENCPEILHDISFEMKAGTTLGILGGTGSGKSTLMLLLDKLYDLPEDCGEISIGGTDIRKLKTSEVRRGIGMVLQEPYLFSRSISDNIGIANEGLTLSEIREAARDACLHDSIEGFAKGYDTFVGERGVTLSGGQKQRAAIARTLTQQTPIMIFDDSLSAVDTETDARIRKALESRFGRASIIIISHRITTLSKADKILALENGSIAEQGTHDQLRTAGGIYQRIYEIQSGTAAAECREGEEA